jgi:hypothetical protein
VRSGPRGGGGLEEGKPSGIHLLCFPPQSEVSRPACEHARATDVAQGASLRSACGAHRKVQLQPGHKADVCGLPRSYCAQAGAATRKFGGRGGLGSPNHFDAIILDV